MIDLTRETENLARRLASVEQVSVDVVVRQALEARAGAIGLAPARLGACPRLKSSRPAARSRQCRFSIPVHRARSLTTSTCLPVFSHIT